MSDTQLRDPQLDEGDARQIAYGLLEAMGISIVLYGAAGAEDLAAEAARLSPILLNSDHLGLGFMRLQADPETTWVIVEGTYGSALIVYGSPESDVSLMLSHVMTPFESAQAPFARGLVTRGSTEAQVAAILEGSDVIPAWEVPAFAALSGPVIDGMPLAIRRAARDWKRLSNNLYLTTVTHPDQADVHLWSVDGTVELVTAIGDGQTPAWVEPLVAQGSHRLDFIDQSVLLATAVVEPITAESLQAQAQQLIHDVSNAYAGVRSAVQAPLPPEPDGAGVWERVARAADRAGRVWSPPAQGEATYGFVERVRESEPEGSDHTFESANALAHWLRSQRSTGFEYAWRGPDDRLQSPTWLTVLSVAVDAETGNIAAAAHLTHEVWGAEPAHDLGAIDGRNLATFSSSGHPGGLVYPSKTLYVGSTRTGRLLPLDATLNVISLDLYGPTGDIAVLHHLRSSDCAVSVVSASGEQRLLTVITDMSGNELTQFSPDGRWILVPRSKDSVLIEVATGRWVVVLVANTTWWPLAESGLLTIFHQDGVAFPSHFSLSANDYTRSFPVVELDVPLLESYPYVWGPQVSADGTEVIARSPAGVSVEYQAQQGTGSHLVRFELETGIGTLVTPPFLNAEQTLERDVTELRWIGARRPAHPVELHPELLAELNEPVREHQYLAKGRWDSDAEQMLVKVLNRTIDASNAGDAVEVARLLPEVLASLVPIAHSVEGWERQSEWITGLRDNTTNMIAAGTFSGEIAATWTSFGSAVAAIEAGRPDLIDSVV